MLRGPQTPGELRARTERLHRFGGPDELHATLERLIARELVARLGRRPGQKEERYAQLLGGDAEAGAAAAHEEVGAPGTTAALEERVVRLERDVEELRELLESLGGSR